MCPLLALLVAALLVTLEIFLWYEEQPKAPDEPAKAVSKAQAPKAPPVAPSLLKRFVAYHKATPRRQARRPQRTAKKRKPPSAVGA